MGTTVIDELVVSLGLDPTKFNQGQIAAIKGLRNFEKDADDFAKRLNQNTGKKFSDFFHALQNPINTAKQGLMDIADTSVRAGNTVEKAGNAGATGMASIARGALLAYAAVKGVQDVMNGLRDTAKATEQIGFMSKATGVPVGWESQFARANLKLSGAPEGQTEGWLLNLRQNIEAYRGAGYHSAGQSTGLLDALQRQGIQFLPEWKNLSDDQIIQRITQQASNRMAQKAAEMGGGTEGTAAASAMGITQFNMPLLMAQNLSGGWDNFAKVMAEMPAITEADAVAANKLEQAERDTEIAAGQLTVELVTGLAPGLIKVLEVVKAILGFFGGLKSPSYEDRTSAPLAKFLKRNVSDSAFRWLYGDPDASSGSGSAPSSSPASSTSGDWSSLSFGERQVDAMQYLMGKGFTKNQAAGKVGQWWSESTLDPSGKSTTLDQYGNPHRGLAQWDPVRWDTYLQSLPANADPNNAHNQMDFSIWEEANSPSERLAGQRLAFAQTPEDASDAEELTERSGNSAKIARARNYARQLSTLQFSQAGGNTTISNNNSRTVGNINVTVASKPGDNPAQVGNTIADHINRNVLATTFNTGQE